MDSFEPLEQHQLWQVDNLPLYRISDYLNNAAIQCPNKTFLVFPAQNDLHLTYDCVAQEVHRIADLLTSLGIQKGDRVAVCLYNTDIFVCFLLASALLDTVIVPINPDLKAPEIEYIVEHSGARRFFYHDTLARSLGSLFQQTKAACYAVLSDEQAVQPIELKRPPSKKNNISYQPVQNVEMTYLYTSGTTGAPKGVVLSQLNFVSDAVGIVDALKFDSLTRTLCVLPMFHNNGIVSTLLCPLVANGTTIVMKNSRTSMRSFIGLLARYEITWTSVMPTILASALLSNVQLDSRSMKGILCGGQRLTPELRTSFCNRFHVAIFEGYGLTETTSFATMSTYPLNPSKSASVGAAMAINTIGIVGPNGEFLPENSEGEVCIRGLNVCLRYYNNPELTQQRFADGWFRTGDFGYLDEDGYLFFIGRQDDLIVRAGEKIYPAEIEGVLQTHPAVEEVAVIGVPYEVLGEEICAFVKLRPDHSCTSAELRSYCTTRLAYFKVPALFVFLHELEDMPNIPKGPTGKILHKALRTYWQQSNLSDRL